MRADNYPVMDKRLFWRAYCSLRESGALEAPPSVVQEVLRRDERDGTSLWPSYLDRWGGTWLA